MTGNGPSYQAVSYSFDCFGFGPPDLGSPRADKPTKKVKRSPEYLAAMAMDRTIALASPPDLRVAPARIGLTGLPTFFWLDDAPEPITATAAAGGTTVTARARPVEYIWDFDDGGTRSTSNPGRKWTRRSDGTISHTYEANGTYAPVVEVVWAAEWSMNGGGWRHLGYFSNSDSIRYPVRELIAMLVRAR